MNSEASVTVSSVERQSAVHLSRCRDWSPAGYTIETSRMAALGYTLIVRVSVQQLHAERSGVL